MLAVRLAPIKQADNLSPEQGMKMETTTTNKEAYQGQRVTPAAMIRPAHKPMGNNTPFKGTTENRESFTNKPIEHVKAFRLKDNNIMSGSFEGASGYKEQFKDRGVVKTKSYAPSYEYRKPSAKFSHETTSKNDFVAYTNVRKQPCSTVNKGDHWQEVQSIGAGIPLQTQSTYKHDFPVGAKMGDKVSYQPPVSTLKLGKENVELSTNYKDDFTFRSMSKPKSYAPQITFIKPGVKMDSHTEAHDQFKGQFLPPPQSFRPKYELDPNRPPMDISTNYADSFKKFQFISDAFINGQGNALPSIDGADRQNQQASVPVSRQHSSSRKPGSSTPA
ncbi:stabilizer of axonemal microtubules 1-like [Watersipora subatra]|uniref:stabilizer of axonemal microtubules 1-like n=1 Tax=Watersipora subatra TaxID=2589382 RepID=UPI00355BEAE0